MQNNRVKIDLESNDTIGTLSSLDYLTGLNVDFNSNDILYIYNKYVFIEQCIHKDTDQWLISKNKEEHKLEYISILMILEMLDKAGLEKELEKFVEENDISNRIINMINKSSNIIEKRLKQLFNEKVENVESWIDEEMDYIQDMQKTDYLLEYKEKDLQNREEKLVEIKEEIDNLKQDIEEETSISDTNKRQKKSREIRKIQEKATKIIQQA